MKKLSKEEIKKNIEEIVRDKYREEFEVTLGENRKQLLIRIPKPISNRMNFVKGQKIKLVISSHEIGKNQFNIEVI